MITAERVEAEEGPQGRIVRLAENVTVTRLGATLRGARGVYYESEGHVVIFGNVTGEDAGRTIRCDTLDYFLDTDVAYLRGNASYTDTSATTTADRIHMLRGENVAVCRGNVRSRDSDATSELLAGSLVYDFDTGEGRASKGPTLKTYDDEGTQGGTLTADVIEFSTATDAIRAFGRVTIEREDITASARAASLGRGGSIVLVGDPSVQQGEDRLTGNLIRVSTDDGEVSRVVSIGNARATYHIEPDEPGEDRSHGVVGGDTLTMFMEEGQPVLTTVRGHAESEHSVGGSGERNFVTSWAIDVLFTENRIKRVVFRGQASGTYSFPPEASATAEPAVPVGPPEGAEPAEQPESEAAAEQLDAPLPESPADSIAFDTVVYQSDEINYYVARNRIVLTGAARVEHQTTVLLADDIMFDPGEQVLEASGNPDLRERQDRLVGAHLS